MRVPGFFMGVDGIQYQQVTGFFHPGQQVQAENTAVEEFQFALMIFSTLGSGCGEALLQRLEGVHAQPFVTVERVAQSEDYFTIDDIFIIY